MALTDKKRRFVCEYLIDLNATQAAIRAGFSERTARSQGQRLLTNVDVQQAIAEAQQKRSERTEITQDRVLREYARLAFADIRKVAKWGESVAVTLEDGEGETILKHSVALLSSADIDDDTALAIEEVSEGKAGLKIKMHDKKGALDSVARHLGMFVDRSEIKVTQSLSEELSALNNALRNSKSNPPVA